MEPEDLEPIRTVPEKKNLDIMSIEELQEYIGDLEAEIVRARETIEHKQAAKSSADGFFKK